MDWLTHIADYTNQLADGADGADPTSPVPTCPAWTMSDLVWHLAEVQDFWTWIITHRPAPPNNYPEPNRPADHELPALLRAGCSALLDELRPADSSDEAWSWSADHSVGFTKRRQAHEAFVHLADARIALEGPLPQASPEFGADGVEELITHNLSPIPDWGSFTPDADRVIRLEATDAKADWTLRFGRFNGTSPTSGTTYEDEPQVQRSTGVAQTVVSGEAALLDLWMWGRAPDDRLMIAGDRQLAADLRTVVSGETQ